MRSLALLILTVGVVYGSNDMLPEDLENMSVEEIMASANNWVDPNDPSAGLKAADVLTCASPASQTPPDPTLRLILNRIMHQLSVDPSMRVGFERTASISLSSAQVAVLDEYLSGEEAGGESYATREAIRAALHDAFTVIEEQGESKLDRLMSSVWPWVQLANLGLLLPAGVIVAHRLLGSFSLVKTILFLVFAVSMVTTFNRMYAEKEAARIALMMREADYGGDACRPAGMWQQTLDSLTGMFVMKTKGRCERVLEAQRMSILSEISPVDVLMDVLGNTMFGWMTPLARHVNGFVRMFYEGIPLHVSLMMTVVLAVVVVFALFAIFGFRFRSIFFTIEPAGAGAAASLLGGIARSLEGPPAIQQSSQHAIRGAERREGRAIEQLHPPARSHTPERKAIGGPLTTPTSENVTLRRRSRPIHAHPYELDESIKEKIDSHHFCSPDRLPTGRRSESAPRTPLRDRNGRV